MFGRKQSLIGCHTLLSASCADNFCIGSMEWPFQRWCLEQKRVNGVSR